MMSGCKQIKQKYITNGRKRKHTHTHTCNGSIIPSLQQVSYSGSKSNKHSSCLHFFFFFSTLINSSVPNHNKNSVWEAVKDIFCSQRTSNHTHEPFGLQNGSRLDLSIQESSQNTSYSKTESRIPTNQYKQYLLCHKTKIKWAPNHSKIQKNNKDSIEQQPTPKPQWPRWFLSYHQGSLAVSRQNLGKRQPKHNRSTAVAVQRLPQSPKLPLIRTPVLLLHNSAKFPKKQFFFNQIISKSSPNAKKPTSWNSNETKARTFRLYRITS